MKMIELPDDLTIHGFSFAADLSKIKMGEMHDNLSNRNVKWSDVILSAWEDIDSDCTWVIAADRYLDEKEVKNVIEYILENSVEEEYLLTSFVAP